jgi:PadR family transcriptional regulator AphA
LLEEIEAHQALHQKTLQSLLSIEQSYLSLPPEKQANYKLPYLTLRRGIIGEQAWLSWAEEALESIKK